MGSYRKPIQGYTLQRVRQTRGFRGIVAEKAFLEHYLKKSYLKFVICEILFTFAVELIGRML